MNQNFHGCGYMSLSPSILNIFFFNEEDESVKSPRSNEPIKSKFGLNATSEGFNENILAHTVHSALLD